MPVVISRICMFSPVHKPPNFGQAARKEIVPVLTTAEKEARRMKDFRDGIGVITRSLGGSKIFEGNVSKNGEMIQFDPI